MRRPRDETELARLPSVRDRHRLGDVEAGVDRNDLAVDVDHVRRLRRISHGRERDAAQEESRGGELGHVKFSLGRARDERWSDDVRAPLTVHFANGTPG